MKSKITSFLFLLVSLTAVSQTQKEIGTKFDYDEREKDLKVVLVDNYNHYMSSAINVDASMQSVNKIIIRKFDQKNQLVETFTEEFPYKDVFTLHNYLGSFELQNEKLVVLVECYSNKTKKIEVFQVTFDKKTGLFDKKVIAEYTFESLSKSGATYAMVSQNKNYIGVVHSKFANKKIAEENQCVLIDGKTGDLLWKKDVPFPLLSFTESIVLSDTGKFVFVRTTQETGSQNVLAIADGNTVENKDFGKEDIKIKKPLVFSVGTNEYLIAFDNYAHGINRGEFGKVLFYDLTAGVVLKNNIAGSLSDIKDVSKVNFNTLSIQNDEIYLFVDADFKSGTKPDPTFPNSTFKVAEYSNGYPSLLIFDLKGNLTKTEDFNVMPFKEPSKSLSVLNVKGNYFLNTYWRINNSNGFYGGIYRLNNGAVDRNGKMCSFNEPNEEGIVMAKFSNYLPDAKRLIIAKSYGANKMAFMNVLNIQL
ncbi:hypothetical protein [Flavobacterium sp. KACC 22761]|uniref:hypothetical protein n=1 Tax=Flavobacterium sp. KACC 22761 TaxID=3092665 RepID=UPI002A760BDD|nr:hypothetical protein [Flavobacterium sp. KACC 22761]WPO77016.1 hypothetical protein SCB73_12170 [Flavobacterium sp. KACC 22761]